MASSVHAVKSWKAAGPSFLLGVALALIGEVTAGLLLYGGPGFLPALSVVLATLLAALAAGLAVPIDESGREAEERVRRHWIALLLLVTAGCGYALAWEVFGGFGAGVVGQAAGLALLGALPFYQAGRVLAFLTVLPGTGGRGRVGAATLVGVAVGVLAVGFVLFPLLTPGAAVLMALAAVSGAALVHGWALDEVLRVERVERHVGFGGIVELEVWVRGSPRDMRLAVRENGRLRILIDRDGTPISPEDRAVCELVRARLPTEPRVISIGLGAAVLAESLRSSFSGLEHRAHVADPEALRMLLQRIDTLDGPAMLRAPADERAGLQIHRYGAGGLPDDTRVGPSDADTILVDSLEAAATPATARLEDARLRTLRSMLRPGGILVFGPLLELSGGPRLPDRFLAEGRGVPGSALYIGPRGENADMELPRDRAQPRAPIPDDARRAFLVVPASVLAPAPGAEWPEAVAGFLRVELVEVAAGPRSDERP